MQLESSPGRPESGSTAGSPPDHAPGGALNPGQLRMLELMASGAALPDILDLCITWCEYRSPGLIGSILLLDPDGRRLRHGASPRLPAAFTRAIDGAAIGPAAGSCGTAAYRGEPVFVADIASDPVWAEWRDLALSHGLRACWSTPIKDSRKAVLGTFAMYFREPGLPAPHHLELIGQMTHLASLAISRHRVEEEKRRIFDRISDAFVALDPQWRYTHVNEKAGALFGREPETLVGKNIWSEFPEGVGQPFQLAYAKAMREQQPGRIEAYYPPFDRWFENRIFPSAEGLSIYFTDITDRKREEEACRQRDKLAAIGQLASGIAHDFNNNLSIIRGYAELLGNRLPDDALRRYVESILAATESSGELTRSLLDFGRTSPQEALRLDFHELVEAVVGLLGHTFDRKIELRRSLAAPRSHVLGDPASLQSALLNLALNARDAMPGGGVLSFSTTVTESLAGLPFLREVADGPSGTAGGEAAARSWLHLEVTDTGAGMTESVRRRIFEPFFTTKAPGKGTGLGLPSVFGTLRSHGGRIGVESAPGKGTVFHVLLPLIGEED